MLNRCQTLIVMIALLCAYSNISLAQAQLEALITEYDFGEIKEQKGSVKHTFTIKNVGTLPLIITDVKPSCGCTTPYWTQDEILPNKEGTLVAEFNPLGRPGTFKKSLTVSSNSSTGKEYFFIVGNVIPKPKSFTDEYPIAKGNIFLKQNLFDMGEIKNNQTITKKFDYYNNSAKPITFLNHEKLPDYISVTFNTKTIPTKSEGHLSITYDATKLKDLGFVTNILHIKTDDAIEPTKKVPVFADIQLFFPKLSVEEQKKQPKIEFDRLIHDFGTVQEKGTLKYAFSFTNKGQNPLKVLKYKTSCSCLSVKLEKKVIAFEEKTNVEVTFNTTGRQGNQMKTIELFVNDPINPIPKLTIRADLTKPK